MDTQVKQRVCGLLGGIAYASTADYYNQMNQLVSKFLPGHCSRIHIVSVDIFQYIETLNNSQWAEAAEYLLEGVHQLVKSGIDFLLICSNTGHIAAPRILEYYPKLVLLHISDAVAFAIKEKKLKKVGFFGSKFAMVSSSCVVERLIQHGLEIVFPNNDDMERVHQIIVDELTINVITEESKQFYRNAMQRLYDEQQVEGIVLGCTEIPLLVKQTDLPHIPLFDSTQLHAQLAVDYQLGRYDIDSFLPPNIKKVE
ncbi:unnamed protein product [Rotaria socialis]|uniref:Aspartate racemase n=1 Tax=Rotaria socialis TaxID=392032 RepID=A0A819VVL0_9BILA|nr:unnamed protein product [Rotaria socialis]CAF3346453.1 unnamed protein product [Rotaria socialis]CAF3459868.1 unnamed protein product [Rotaria socialis]CAF3464482.1 unnamed protein product [Rotaria socialis]CAF3640128.1 unnamed protein product [Rotaria socialis]